MSDGRTVALGTVDHVKKGEYLEVYADLAVAKADGNDVEIISKARQS